MHSIARPLKPGSRHLLTFRVHDLMHHVHVYLMASFFKGGHAQLLESHRVLILNGLRPSSRLVFAIFPGTPYRSLSMGPMPVSRNSQTHGGPCNGRLYLSGRGPTGLFCPPLRTWLRASGYCLCYADVPLLWCCY